MRVAHADLHLPPPITPLLCSDVFIHRDFVLTQGAQTSGSLPASRRRSTLIESSPVMCYHAVPPASIPCGGLFIPPPSPLVLPFSPINVSSFELQGVQTLQVFHIKSLKEKKCNSFLSKMHITSQSHHQFIFFTF